jgi:hypothetical protein
VYLRDCPRAEECPHEFVEVSTQAFGPLLYSVESSVHLSRTKRRNSKWKGGARSFASGSLLTLLETFPVAELA